MEVAQTYKTSCRYVTYSRFGKLCLIVKEYIVILFLKVIKKRFLNVVLECVYTFNLVLFEQVGYFIFLVQYRKVFSDQYNFFERVDLTFVLLYVYCVLRRMGGIFLLCIEGTFD